MNWIKEIRNDISAIQSTPHDLKKFGLTIGSVLLLLCCVAFWKGGWNTTILIAVVLIGMFLIISGMFLSQLLRVVHCWWMSFAIILGSVVSRIILVIVFFSIVLFISIAARIFGKKFYINHKDQERSSYWIGRDQSKHINYERMS